jgi:hypothetical protein
LSDDWAEPLLSAAILHAAARYNAFHFHNSDGDESKEAAAIDYYCDQYRQMLQENMRQLRKG